MKKRIVLVTGLVLMFAFLLVSCGSGGSTEAEPGTDAPAQEEAAQEEAVQEEDAEELQLLESGYCVTDDNYINYAFVIENPSQTTAFEFPEVTITAYDENGDVLATDYQTLGQVQPGEKQAFGTIADCNGQRPAKVEFDLDSGEMISPSEDAIKSSDFEISGTNEREDEYGETAVTGKIKNNSAKDAESAAVTVLFKKEGLIVCGTTSFVDNIRAGKEKAFEVTEYEVSEHDSYEVYAIEW